MAKKNNKDWLNELRDYFLWIAIGCLFTNFILDWESVRKTFGVYIFMAKLINAACIWFFGILAGKNTFQLVSRFFKAVSEIKKGNDLSEEDEEIEIEND